MNSILSFCRLGREKFVFASTSFAGLRFVYWVSWFSTNTARFTISKSITHGRQNERVVHGKCLISLANFKKCSFGLYMREWIASLCYVYIIAHSRNLCQGVLKLCRQSQCVCVFFFSIVKLPLHVDLYCILRFFAGFSLGEVLESLQTF